MPFSYSSPSSFIIQPVKRTATRAPRARGRALPGNPPFEARYFVREIAGQRQARTARSPLEPSAHAPMVMHHNSWWARKARIIVLVGLGTLVVRSDIRRHR